jgi:hypothetical protein
MLSLKTNGRSSLFPAGKHPNAFAQNIMQEKPSRRSLMQIIMRRISLLSTKETVMYCTASLPWMQVEAKNHAGSRSLRHIGSSASDWTKGMT